MTACFQAFRGTRPTKSACLRKCFAASERSMQGTCCATAGPAANGKCSTWTSCHSSLQATHSRTLGGSRGCASASTAVSRALQAARRSSVRIDRRAFGKAVMGGRRQENRPLDDDARATQRTGLRAPLLWAAAHADQSFSMAHACHAPSMRGGAASSSAGISPPMSHASPL